MWFVVVFVVFVVVESCGPGDKELGFLALVEVRRSAKIQPRKPLRRALISEDSDIVDRLLLSIHN